MDRRVPVLLSVICVVMVVWFAADRALFPPLSSQATASTLPAR